MELVVFSPSVGEYVTIAWYSWSTQCNNLQSLILFMLGQHIMAAIFWRTEPRSGFAIVGSIGHAFVV